MDRRELLKMVALLTGGVVIGGEVFLTGCKTGVKTEAGFTPANIALLDEVGETILPATSSPGAKAAQVGEFMKVYVTDCYNQEAQDVFTKGMTDLQEACNKMHSKSFMDCTPDQRKQLLLKLEEEAKPYNKALEDKDKPGRDAAKEANKEYDFVPSARHYYTMMKQLTLLGFFTSKPGATQALRNVPVPGRYDGALPYKKGDKAFSV
jgi:Gluconate 2-dehydrogenase subunit 3